MPAGNGLAPQLEAHEDRLQRVEAGVADLRVKVAEVSIKQDLYHQASEEQTCRIVSKIDGLSKAEEKLERKHEHEDKEEPWWMELLPVKLVRKYIFHILAVAGGAIGHKGLVALLEWLAKKA